VKRLEVDTNFFALTLQDLFVEKPKKEKSLMKNPNANAKYSLMNLFVRKFVLSTIILLTRSLQLSLETSLKTLKEETTKMRNFVKSFKKRRNDLKREFK